MASPVAEPMTNEPARLPSASDELIRQIADAIQDRRTHIHPDRGLDFYCVNLVAYMGEQMAPVLTRLSATEAERDRLRGFMVEAFEKLEAQKPYEAESLLREVLYIPAVGD